MTALFGAAVLQIREVQHTGCLEAMAQNAASVTKVYPPEFL